MRNSAGPRYTPEEIKIVMTCNHRKARRLLPHRSASSISQKRFQIRHGYAGKKKDRRKNPHYTAEQVETLRKHFHSMKVVELRNKFFPDKAVTCVQHKANSLGLNRKPQIVPALDGSKEIVRQILVTAKERGIHAQALDQLCETKYFRVHWRKWPLNLIAIARATELLGGRILADFTLHPFGDESKRLLTCLGRYLGDPVPNVAKPKQKPKTIKPRRDLAYPFARALDSGNKLVIEVNELVPHNMAGREDVCQTILLAIVEGKITVDQLRAQRNKIKPFIVGFMKANYEAGGHAISIDEPRSNGVRLRDSLPATGA